MKKLYVLLTLTISFVFCFGQANRDISFLQGLGNTCAWNQAAVEIDNLFVAFTSVDIYAPTTDPIESHDINYGGAQNSVVAHSLGGLVARSELIEGDNFDHLITIGTPHLGAPITAQGQNIGTLTVWWLEDILAGPCAEFGGAWCFAENWVTQVLGVTVFPLLVQEISPLNEPSTNQMIPGSAFMTNLNNNFANSLPTPLSANRFIFGVEDWNDLYRLLESTVSDCEPEVGTAAGVANLLGQVYLLIATNHFYNFHSYLLDFYASSDWWSLFQAFYHLNLAIEWMQGANSLLVLQQLEWSAYIDGSLLPNGDYWTSDAVVPTYSQIAAGLMNQNFVRFSLHTNHNEETLHRNAIDAVAISLDEVGVF